MYLFLNTGCGVTDLLYNEGREERGQQKENMFHTLYNEKEEKRKYVAVCTRLKPRPSQYTQGLRLSRYKMIVTLFINLVLVYSVYKTSFERFCL